MIAQRYQAPHTRQNTIEHVRPESLSVMLQLVLDMLQALDAPPPG